MSTFIIHALIPPLTALAARYVPARYVWAWVWVSVVPDIDYLGWILYVNEIVPVNVHRAILHNVFLLLLLLALLARGYARFRVRSALTSFRSYVQTAPGAAWLLSSYYYFSHLLLDLFAGGVVPFWPVSSTNVYSYFLLSVNTETQEVSTTAGTETSAGAPDVTPVYPWLDGEQFGILVLMLASFSFAYALWRRERRVRVIRAVRVGGSEGADERTAR